MFAGGFLLPLAAALALPTVFNFAKDIGNWAKGMGAGRGGSRSGGMYGYGRSRKFGAYRSRKRRRSAKRRGRRRMPPRGRNGRFLKRRSTRGRSRKRRHTRHMRRMRGRGLLYG